MVLHYSTLLDVLQYLLLLLLLLLQVIYDSVRMKAEVVAADEREAGLRGTLNWGEW